MEDSNPQYNKAYIRAKRAQVARHEESHPDKPSQNRLPPGQVETKGFPILDLGVRPSKERYSRWTLEIKGSVANSAVLTLDDLKRLGGEEITADFHCVTRWSRFDLHWSGIPFSKIIDFAKPDVSTKFVVFRSYDKYTTNVSLQELEKPGVIVAFSLEGEEIPPEHGGPIRMIIPHLYGWKSAKFLTIIEFLDHDMPGFWEVRGYSNRAQPWIEERYSDV